MAAYAEMDSAQFENVNSLRAYPFSGERPPMDRIGRVLPPDMVVDLHMVVPAPFGNPEPGTMERGLPEVRMSSLHVSRAMVSVCFVSRLGDSVDALSVTVSRDRFAPYVPYAMEKLSGSEDIGGVVTFGNIGFSDPPETYFFDDAVVHPCCVAAIRPSGLRRFTDPRSGESVSGYVAIDFTGFVRAERDGDSVSLGLEDGAAGELESDCSGSSLSSACGATPIRSINGVRPDKDGNIVLWFR